MKIIEVKNKIKNSPLFGIFKFFHIVWLYIKKLSFLNQLLYFVARMKGKIKGGSIRFSPCICGDNSYELFLDYGKYKILKCLGCGLKRTSPLPSDAVYYNNDMVTSYLRSHNDLHPHIITLLNYIGTLTNIHDYVLDIGCGDGGALQNLHDRGYDNLFGVELSHSLNRMAFERGVAKIYEKSIEDCVIDHKFKLIYLNHVFEHILNPEKFLRAIELNLVDGGYLIIASPNIDSPFAINANWGYAFRQHYWQYTPQTLRQVVEKKSHLKAESFFTIRGNKFWKIKLFNKMKVEGDVVCMVFKK